MPTSLPRPSELSTLVYDADEADLLVSLLRERDVPGTLHACTDPEQARAVIAGAHVVVSGPFPNELLAEAAELRWIQSLWAGIDSWLDAPIPDGVPLTRMTGIFDRHMSEYVFAHLLVQTQLVHHFHHAHRAGLWAPPARTTTLAGRSLGIAGLGHVGRRVAHIAAALRMPVRGLRRSVTGDQEAGFPVYPASRLADFLRGLDVLVLAIPATAESRGLVGAEQLSLLAPGAMVVNIGRGGVVDEDAVVAALDSGHLSHAVLDTFGTEPLPADSPLWTHPSVTLTPHVSGPVYPEAVADVVAANIARFLDGQLPEPVAQLDRGY